MADLVGSMAASGQRKGGVHGNARSRPYGRSWPMVVELLIFQSARARERHRWVILDGEGFGNGLELRVRVSGVKNGFSGFLESACSR